MKKTGFIILIKNILISSGQHWILRRSLNGTDLFLFDSFGIANAESIFVFKKYRLNSNNLVNKFDVIFKEKDTCSNDLFAIKMNKLITFLQIFKMLKV